MIIHLIGLKIIIWGASVALLTRVSRAAITKVLRSTQIHDMRYTNDHVRCETWLFIVL